MEQIGAKFSSGYMLITLYPDTKKVIIKGNINNTALSGSTTLKPVKASKE